MNAADLLEETRRAWGGSPPLAKIAEKPRPGDIFALAERAELSVEWVVLEREEETDRLLVVAADGQPLVGSADVEVPASQSGGPMVLRCRFGGWVNAGTFASAIRTGTLGADGLAQARDRRAMVEGSDGRAVPGSVLALEVDDETPYLAWVRETLEPAWKALGRPTPVAAKPESRRPDVRRWAARRREARHRRHGPHFLALAATVLLAVAATTFWRQHQELLDRQSAVDGYQRDVEELRREQERLMSEHQQQLDEAEARRGQLETRIDELGRQLEIMSSQNTVFNPVVKSLEPPRGRRGQPNTVRLHEGASHLLLAVALEVPGQLYRAELVDQATGEIVWEKSDLRREPLGLWIGPPAARIRPGEYLLRIFELTRDASEPEAEYRLHVLGGQ